MKTGNTAHIEPWYCLYNKASHAYVLYYNILFITVLSLILDSNSIQQMFIEHLYGARSYAWHWGYRNQ